MIKNLILRNRSYRRFFQDNRIENETLVEIINNARITASARNIQPLKYASTTEEELCDKIFTTLSWAGYIENGAPKKGEQPSGYIIIFNDKNIAPNSLWDQGIVSQAITLNAVEKGLGCCIIASVNREKFKQIISHDENLEVALIIAIGHPKEQVEITELENNEYKYYRNENGVHFVPKRSFNEVYIEVNSKK